MIIGIYFLFFYGFFRRHFKLLTKAFGKGWYGDAPYLIQLPSGQTIFSCRYAGGRNISYWEKSTMTVFAGNSMATHFTNESYPWPNLPADEGAYFSSLFLKNDTAIVLVTTRNFPDGHSEI